MIGCGICSALADDVGALNVTLNAHPHLKSPIESLEEIKEFFSRVRVPGRPEIRLCLDPRHTREPAWTS